METRETWEELLSRVPMLDQWAGVIPIDGESPFVTDGHVMFRRVYADSRRLERLLQIPAQERTCPPENAERLWRRAVEAAVYPLKTLKMYETTTQLDLERQYRLGFDCAGLTIVFDAVLLRCMALLLGFDQLKGYDPEKEAVAYRKGEPVALLMPITPSPEVLVGVRGGLEEPA